MIQESIYYFLAILAIKTVRDEAIYFIMTNNLPYVFFDILFTPTYSNDVYIDMINLIARVFTILSTKSKFILMIILFLMHPYSEYLKEIETHLEMEILPSSAE